MTQRTEILHENLERYLEDHPLSGNTLVVDDHPMGLRDAQDFVRWHTRFHPRHSASTHPDCEKPYDNILIRLPKSHEYFDFVLHMTLPLLANAGTFFVYGFTDEGIKGAQKKLKEFFDNIEPVYIKNHARIVATSSPHPPKKDESPSHKILKDFAKTHTIDYQNKKNSLTYYPGMFGSGTLDEGTKLLLDTTLSKVKDQQKILDYAAGSGIIARVILDQHPETAVDLLDNDTLSIVAARQNVPSGSSFLLADSLANCPDKIEYDLIISNPPIHTEKSEQFHTLYGLIEDAHHVLASQGRLVLVAQARIDLNEHFTKCFTSHDILAETAKFKVWEGRGAK